MRISFVLFAAFVGSAAAHGEYEGQHIPKLLGARKFLADLKLRQPVPLPGPVGPRIPRRSDKRSVAEPELGQKRQIEDNIDGPCGPGAGSCAPGYCCSAEGWCGTGLYFCSAPDCQINYGPACDGNQKPWGVDTGGVSRPKVGSVPYGGAGVWECKKTGDIALTFDDGPYIYTADLLDKLRSYGAKATFFITGNNLGKGQINDPGTIYPGLVKRMYNEGHQIASHTWSHENASRMTNTQFRNQMVWNEIAINSLLGFFPTYMRPPYSICERNCQTILADLGYHAIYFDLDTAGYLNDSPKAIQTSKNIWDQAMRKSDPSKDGFLQIEHDIHTQVVYNLTDYILTSLYANGYRAVTVGECLGDPESNWYRAGPAGSVGTPPSSFTSATTARSTTSIRSAVTTRSTVPVTNIPTIISTRSRTTVSTRSTIPFPTTQTTPRTQVTIRTTIRTTSNPQLVTVTSFPANTRSTIPVRPTATVRSGPSTDGTCGNGVTCAGTRFGACCSPFGYCGNGDDFCQISWGCQPDYGSCEGSVDSPDQQEGAEPLPEIINGPFISSDGRCGPETDQTCTGSAFGDCCGPSSQCSQNLIYCLAILGCQTGYGACI